MVQSQFSLSWDAYKSNICGGFGSLQQNGEFVDMTLAADGHFVKVHQVLMALVSPYLKDLLTSAPCQHPVIFLNNVSHKTLCSLLEYIYTGEVLIPSDNLGSFVTTAKSLHIKGLEDIVTGAETMSLKTVENTSQVDDNILCHLSGVKSLSSPAERNTGQVNLPNAARRVLIKHENVPKLSSLSAISKQVSNTSMNSKDNIHDYSDMMDDSVAQDSDDFPDEPNTISQVSNKNTDDTNDASSSNLQYSMSIRGSLQVILNRYIYNLHSTTHRTGVRRWRCVDYRNQRCMAFVVTKGNVVLNRANLHNHSFHDKKILQKIEKKAVFSALDDVQGYKEKECGKETDTDTAMEQEEYMTLDLADAMADEKKDWSIKQTQ